VKAGKKHPSLLATQSVGARPTIVNPAKTLIEGRNLPYVANNKLSIRTQR